MLAEIHHQLAAAAEVFLKQSSLSPATPRDSVLRATSTLRLQPPTSGLQPSLIEEGCSGETVEALMGVFEAAVAQLSCRAQETFTSTLDRVSQSFPAGEEQALLAWTAGIERAWRRQFDEAVQSCERRIVEGVRLARLRHSSSLPSSSSTPSAPAAAPSEPGTFSPQNLALLNAAFSVRDSVSRAERRELARATGLNERQVLTWFANQRQRRGKKEKQSTGNARPSPYSHARHPSSHHLPPLRTVSGSSTASSTSLLSYASANSGSDEDIDIDIEVDYPTAPSSQPQTATFANFASQYQVAPLPLPLPPPPATFFQPPPTHGGEEGVEVPMMAFTSPTPITASFSALGVSSSSSSSLPQPSFNFSQPLFLPSTNPSPPSEGAAEGSVIDHLETATEWDAESFFSSSSTTSSCGAVPVAPAPTPSLSAGVGGEGGALDGWMDATFYENLLSSLGLTSSPSSEGDSSSTFGATLPFDFGAADGGGLTLSIDAVRADVGGGFGAGAAAGVFGF